MTRLLADIPRCYGIDRHSKCESCARKHQMERGVIAKVGEAKTSGTTKVYLYRRVA